MNCSGEVHTSDGLGVEGKAAISFEDLCEDIWRRKP